MITVLLIDDDRNMHQYTRTVLESSQHQVLSAHSGCEGLEMLNAYRPDVVLLDYMMPELDGYKVFEIILKDEKYQQFRDIPIIMLTALDERSEVKDHLLQMGLAAYLNKPFGHKELINVIENILSTNKRYLRSKKLNESIKNAKDFLENIIESSPDAFITTDMEGFITSFSRSAELLFGHSAGKITGQKLESYFPDANEMSKIVMNLKIRQIMQDYETQILTAENQYRPVSFSFSLIKNKENQNIGILGIAKDLTRIKELENKLIEKERLAALTETAVAVNHEINNPLTPILGNIQLLLFRRNEIEDWVVEKLEVIEKNAWRIQNTIQKLNHITKPVKKQYCGETQMLDIERSK